jgi:prolyl oligopeptidase
MRVSFTLPISGLLLCLINAFQAQAAGSSLAAPHPVSTTYYGETLSDPYRWMEGQGADFLAWVHAQNKVTRGMFASLSGYPKLAAEVSAASDAEIRVTNSRRVGDLVYFLKQGRGEAQASLYVRPLSGGVEKRLVDPVRLADDSTAITDYAVSPDNRMLAFSLSGGGSEDATLHVLRLDTGAALPETIDRARMAGPVWSDDGRFLFYDRLKAHFSGPADRFADETIFRHVPGQDPARDVPIFTAAAAGSELGRVAFIGLTLPVGGDWALAFANSGVSHEAEWFAAPVAAITAGGMPAWRRISRLADKLALSLDGQNYIVPIVRGDQAWFPSEQDASFGKIVRVDLRHPDAAHAAVIVPDRGTRLATMGGAADGIYLVYAQAGVYTLRRADVAGGHDTAFAAPFEGAMNDLATDPRRPGAVISLESWARPVSYLEATGGALHDLHLAPDFPIDLSGIIAETIFATAADGTKIPVSVVHRRDMPKDGTAPALVEAYGAYGTANDPYFHVQLMPFLLRGGIYGVPHVRGGGEYGEAWHLAGKGATKPNTWRDFIAGVQALEADGFTSKPKLVGFGASAGGIMIGRVVTERPDLLAGAVMWAPIANALRFETTEGGPANTAEFGSTATKAGYAALRAMDPYSHVVDGTAYPAALITIGLNDHRVPPWMGAELAARLQAATSSGRPIYLRVDDKGGHHVMGVSKDDLNTQITDMLAFVLKETGDADFQRSQPKVK